MDGLTTPPSLSLLWLPTLTGYMAITAANVDGADVSEEEEDRLLGIMDDFESASPGDKVIWDDKTNPLEVRAPDDIDREPKDDTIYVEGPAGGIYELEMRTAPNGIPYINGDHGRSVENFRIVEDDGDEDGDSGGETPGVRTGRTTGRGGADGDEFGPLANLTVSRPPIPGQDRILVKGRHRDAGRFELVFERDGGASYQLNPEASAVEDGSVEDVAEPAEEFLIERGNDILPQFAENADPVVGTRVPTDIGYTASADPSTEQDADEWVFEKTDDIFAEYEDLEPFAETPTLSKIRNSLPFGGAGKFTRGHTFVDELLAIEGVSVPRAYNAWQLFDYGIVDGPEMRSLGWVNVNTQEFILLKGERDADGESPPNYGLYRFNAEQDEPNTLDPVETATGGSHRDRVQSMLMHVQNMMGAPEDLDVEVVEYATDSPGQRFIRDSVDWEAIGKRALDAAEALSEKVYSGAIERGEAAVSWLQNNYKWVGYNAAVSIVNLVSHLIAQVTELRASPVLERGQSNLVERVGIEVGYTYKPSRSKRSFADQKLGEVGPPGNRTDVELKFTRNRDDNTSARDRRNQRRAAVNTISEALQDSGIESIEDLDGVGPQTAANLRAAGFTSISSLVDAEQADIEAAQGVGPQTAESIKAQVGGGRDISALLDNIADDEPTKFTASTKNVLVGGASLIGGSEVAESGQLRDFLVNSRTAPFALLVLGSLEMLERGGLDEYDVRMPGSGDAVRAWSAEKLRTLLPEEQHDLIEDFGDVARRGSGRTEGDKAVADSGDPLLPDEDKNTLSTWKSPKPGDRLPNGDSPTEEDGLASSFPGNQRFVAEQLFGAETNAEAAEILRDIITGEIETALEPNPSRPYTVEGRGGIEELIKRKVEDDIMPVVEEYWPDLHTHLNEKFDRDVQPIEHYLGFDKPPDGNRNLLRPNIGSSQYFYDRVAKDLIGKEAGFTKDDFPERSTSLNNVNDVSKDDVRTNENNAQQSAAFVTEYRNAEDQAEFFANLAAKGKLDDWVEQQEDDEEEEDDRADFSRMKRGESGRDPETTFDGSPP